MARLLKLALLLSFCLSFVCLIPVFAYTGPVAYLTEQVYADYNTDGTVRTATTYAECMDNWNPCRFGYTEVALPNANDTLQTVRVNLSATTGTNLNSVRTYKGTLTSYPNIWGKDKMYVNDSLHGANQNYYKVNDSDAAPAMILNVTNYVNIGGGKDVYDYDNVGAGGSINNMTLNISIRNPSATKSLSNVILEISFDRNSSGGNDSINATSISSGGNLIDTDADGFNDKINWTGTLTAGSLQNISINFTVAETVNIVNGATVDSLDSNNSHKGGKASYVNQTSTLTGLTIAVTYARGSVRQGVDLLERSGGGWWDTMGFIQVIAANSSDVGAGTQLTYNITSWSIYNVSAATGNMTNSIQNGTFSNTNFTANYGRLYTTDSTFSSNTTRAPLNVTLKPYVASSFDWKVCWNDTPAYYTSYINITINMPELYKVDQSVSKTMGGYLSVGTNTTFNCSDTTNYQGSTNATISNITLLSVIPRNTTTGASRTAFLVDNNSIIVSWYNGTDWNVIKVGNGTDNNITVTLTQPSGGANGLINVSIPNLTNTNASRYLNQSEQIRLTYNLSSPADLQTGDSFDFAGNVTLVSLTGTPETERFTNQTMTSSGRQLVGYKDLFVANPAAPTIVNGTLMVQVFGSDISNIYFIDYVPLGTNFTCNTANILFYNSTDGVTWAVSTDISVNDTGTMTLPDGTTVKSCEYRNAAGTGWTLGNNESVRVMYAINISTSGLYEVPMGIAGFDPSTGKEITTTVYGVVRVEVPSEMKELEITQGDFMTAKAIVVGSPVSWVKEFEVFNPNSQFVDSTFSTEVFDDITAGYATYIDEGGNEVKEAAVISLKDGKRIMTWKAKLYPQETRNYELRVLTPPVLETDRNVEVTGVLEDKMVELRMSVFLRSLAAEDYENIQLNLPLSSSSILSITDGEGTSLPYSGDESVKVIIPQIPAKGLKEIVVKYKQSYPKIIITPDKTSYSLDSPVGLDILVIHGGDVIDYPYIETEVYTPDKELVYANIQQLGKLEPIAKTNLYEQFNIPLGASSGRYIAEARLRSDMATLATGTGNFYVSGAESGIAGWVTYLLLLLALGVLYFGVRRIRSAKTDTSAEPAQTSPK